MMSDWDLHKEGKEVLSEPPRSTPHHAIHLWTVMD